MLSVLLKILGGLARRLSPAPDQEGTVLCGEIHHPDGAARVGGILNAVPEKSVRIQQERGPIEFYAWDITKLRGRNVSHLPYGERRELYEAVIKEIRLFNRHLHVAPAMPEGGDPAEFDRAIIHYPRGLPYSEGGVVKYQDSVDQRFQVKANDTPDVRVTRCIEGTGKFAGSLGAIVVEGPTGAECEIGSFQITNDQRQWTWDHRDPLTGQVAEVRAFAVNESGAIRARNFDVQRKFGWLDGPGQEQADEVSAKELRRMEEMITVQTRPTRYPGIS